MVFLRKEERKTTQSKASTPGADGGSYVLLSEVILDYTNDQFPPFGGLLYLRMTVSNLFFTTKCLLLYLPTCV